MRTTLAFALLLAIPTFATAQQADPPLQQAEQAEAEPVVELQQTTPDRAAENAAEADGADAESQAVESRDLPAEDAAAFQDPGTRQWWYIVGAVVVGGLILALLL